MADHSELFADLIPQGAAPAPRPAQPAPAASAAGGLFDDLIPGSGAAAAQTRAPVAELGADGYDWQAVEREAGRQNLLNPGLEISELGMLDGRPIAQPSLTVTPEGASLSGLPYVSPSFTAEAGTVGGVRGDLTPGQRVVRGGASMGAEAQRRFDDPAAVAPDTLLEELGASLARGGASLELAAQAAPEAFRMRGVNVERQGLRARLADHFRSIVDGTFQLNPATGLELGSGIASAGLDLLQLGDRALERGLQPLETAIGNPYAQRGRDTAAQDTLIREAAEYQAAQAANPMSRSATALLSPEGDTLGDQARSMAATVANDPASVSAALAAILPESLLQSVPTIGGAALGGVVGGPGGAAAGAAAGGGLTGGVLQYVPAISEYLQQNGLRADQLNQPAVLDAALAYAETQAQIGGAVEALAGGVAGANLVPERLVSGAVRRELASDLLAQPLAQGAIGAGGAAAQQTAAGQPLNLGELAAEFAGEAAMGPLEAAPAGVARVVESRRKPRDPLTNRAGQRLLPPPGGLDSDAAGELGAAPAPAAAAASPVSRGTEQRQVVLGDDLEAIFEGAEPAPAAADAQRPAVEQQSSAVEQAPAAAPPGEWRRQWTPSGRKDSRGRDILRPVVDYSRDNLLHYLGALGGVDFEELRAQGGADPAVFKDAGVVRPFGAVGNPAVRRNGGLSLEQLRERMQEDGWLPAPDPDAPPSIDNREALDLVMDALAGRPALHPSIGGDARAQAQDLSRGADEAYLDEELAQSLGYADAAALYADLEAADADAELGGVLEEDVGEARSIQDLYDELADMGFGMTDAEIDGIMAAAGDDPGAQAAALWSALQAREEQRNGAFGQANRGPAQAVEQPALGDEPAVAAPRPAAGLFAAATPREEVAAAQRAKDAARDGRTGTGRTDMASGGGELFAGPRPVQTDITNPPQGGTPAAGGAETGPAAGGPVASRTPGSRSLRAGSADVDLRPLGEIGGRDVMVAATESDLPDDVRARYGDNLAGAEGFYDPDSGQVYVIEGNLGGKARTGMTRIQRKRWVVAHERAGHAGLRGLAVHGGGRGLRAVLDEAAENPTVRAIADAMGAKAQGRTEAERGSRLLLVEEALSELAAAAETGDWGHIRDRYGVRVPAAQREGLLALVARLLDAIRAAVGLGSTSDAAIRQILKDANRYARATEAKPTSARGRKTTQPVAQRAYHGTARRGIDRLSTRFMGQGEGNQAFGWGVYTAGNRAVADQYRRGLSVIGRSIGGKLADELMQEFGGDRVRAIERLRRMKSDPRKRSADEQKKIEEAEKFIRADHNRGQVYAQEVPEDYELLAWDAPLSEQPAQVREALEKVIDELGPVRNMSGQAVSLEDISGGELYRMLAMRHGDQHVSETMGAAGIPGLRYLDGGSRGEGTGTYNYVVWDDARIGDAEALLASRAPVDQTETEAFKRWFGDSKVVDADGNPLVVYHGSGAKFDAFDPAKMGQHGQSEGYGFYFSDDESTARGYMAPYGGGSLVDAYLRMQKPMPTSQRKFPVSTLRGIIRQVVAAEMERDPDGTPSYRDSFLSNFVDTYSMSEQRAIDEVARSIYDGNDSAIDQIAELANVAGDKRAVHAAVTSETGYDGIISRGYNDQGESGGTIYVAWQPEQIKSASGNRGTFDPNDPSILASRAPVFRSALLDALRAGKGAPKRADAAGWRGWLDGAVRRGEFKQAERDWLGLDDWLAKHGGAVSRDALIEWVDANQLRLEETRLGAGEEPDFDPDAIDFTVASEEDSNDGDITTLEYEEEATGSQYVVTIDRSDWSVHVQGEGGRFVDVTPGYERTYRGLTSAAEVAMRMDVMRRNQPSPKDGFDGGTKFSRYRTPGGENYREILIRMPERIGQSRIDTMTREELGRWYEEEMGYNPIEEETDISLEEMRDRAREVEAEAPAAGAVISTPLTGAFRSSHWDQDNVLAHLRVDDRTSADGVPTLLVDEIQSDWHQAGRKRGYIGNVTPMDTSGWTARRAPGATVNGQVNWRLEAPGGPIWTHVGPAGATESEIIAAAAQRRAEVRARDMRGVPDAPFKATDEWAMLAFRRAVAEAIASGADRVAWSPGRVHAERYDLSKHVDRIHHGRAPDGALFVAVYGIDGNPIYKDNNQDPSKLEDVVGKEIADRILAGEGSVPKGYPDNYRELSGLDLKVGGEGMIGFYDRILPKAVARWAKRFGGSVGSADIEVADGLAAYEALRADGSVFGTYGQESTARAAVSRAGPGATWRLAKIAASPVHSMDITPAMREAVAEGLPLFSRAPDLRQSYSAKEARTADRLRADARAAVDDLRSLGSALNPARAAAAANRLRAVVFDSMQSRARDLEAKHPKATALRELFDIFFEAPGYDRLVPETLPQATEARQNLFLNRIERHLDAAGLSMETMTRAQNAQLRNAILLPQASVPANIRRAADLIAREMQVQREDAAAAGVDIGEVTDIGYLTRLYDEDKIAADEAGFLRDATAHYRAHEFKREVGVPRDVLYGQGTFGRFVAAFRSAALGDPGLQAKLNRLRALAQSYRFSSNVNGEAAAMQEIIADVYPQVAGDWARRRAMAWLTAIRTPDISRGFNGLLESGAPVTRGRTLSGPADVTLQAWMKTDVREILSAYAGAMAGKIEEARRIGTTPEYLTGLLERAGAQGVPASDLEEATRILAAVTGSRSSSNPTWQTAQEVASAWTYLTLLGRSLFASLYETAAFTLRTGQLRHAISPLIIAGRALSAPLGNTTARDLRRLAVDIGVNGHRAVEDAMLATHTGGDVTNKRVRGVTTRFFRGIWLSQLTEAQRAYGVGASVGFLKSLARQHKRVQAASGARGGATTVETPANVYFRELGIADADAFADWILRQPARPAHAELFDQDGRPTPMGHAFMVATRRLVNQSIQNVRPEHRTEWQNSPSGRIFGAIMGYSMAAYTNILRREFNLQRTLGKKFGVGAAAKRAAVFAAGASMLYVNALVVSTLREALFNAARFEDKDEEEILQELAQLAATRTFGLGTADPLIQLWTGLKYRKSPVETLAGATIGTAAQDMRRVAEALSDETNSPATETAEYRAMEAVYRSVVTPLLNIVLSRVPGLSGVAIPVASGSNIRKRFAGLFYTEPDARSDLDDDYTAATKQVRAARDAIEAQLGALPRSQWQRELNTLKAEYPTMLEGLSLDRYANNAQNRAAGRAGRVKTDDKGNPELVFRAPRAGAGSLYAELEGYPAGKGKTSKGLEDLAGDLTKAINNVRKNPGIRVDDLVALTDGLSGEDIEKLRARAAAGEGKKLAGARLRNGVLEDMLAERRKVKRAVVLLTRKAEAGEPITRGDGKRILEEVRRGR